MIKKRGFSEIESIIRNKEGELLTVDSDGVHILKTYFDGRECNVHDMEECRLAMSTLARLHKASHMEEGLPHPGGSFTVGQEFEKHNRELRRVRKFLREKGQKTDFEIYLMQCYDYFFSLRFRRRRITIDMQAKRMETFQGSSATVIFSIITLFLREISSVSLILKNVFRTAR